jgi:hypothetical protein
VRILDGYTNLDATVESIDCNPSDLVVMFANTLVNPDARERLFRFSLGGYRHPQGPAVRAWHEMTRRMELSGDGARAKLDVFDGRLNGISTCLPLAIGDIECVTSGLQGTGDFQSGSSDPVTVLGSPEWTRSVKYRTLFSPEALLGSRVILGSNIGKNP